MPFFWLSAFVLICLYLAWIGLFYYGWHRTAPWIMQDETCQPGISVVVAARNEEGRISELLESLLKQDYPLNLFEIIIADDHSSDQTAGIVNAFKKRHSNITCASLPAGQSGKKAALRHGITISRFSYILTTDADCRVTHRWIEIMAECFMRTRADLIAGPVLMEGNNGFFSKFQQLEHLSLQGSTAGAIKTGNPVMCSSANLGFRKEAYFGADNTELDSIPSGDDVFLLHAMHRQGDKKLFFIKNKDAAVVTTVRDSPREFIRQRKRWASKSRHYKTAGSIFTALLVFVINAYAVFCLFSGFLVPGFFLIAGFIFIFKSLIDFPFLYSVTGFFQKRELMVWFPLIEIIYFFYISFTAIASLFGDSLWKGRIAGNAEIAGKGNPPAPGWQGRIEGNAGIAGNPPAP
jgi:cellulose synthase/poly-beta-1,6-N-acetylglucosamine synthase-like glycosyltransferase